MLLLAEGGGGSNDEPAGALAVDVEPSSSELQVGGVTLLRPPGPRVGSASNAFLLALSESASSAWLLAGNDKHEASTMTPMPGQCLAMDCTALVPLVMNGVLHFPPCAGSVLRHGSQFKRRAVLTFLDGIVGLASRTLADVRTERSANESHDSSAARREEKGRGSGGLGKDPPEWRSGSTDLPGSPSAEPNSLV